MIRRALALIALLAIAQAHTAWAEPNWGTDAVHSHFVDAFSGRGLLEYEVPAPVAEKIDVARDQIKDLIGKEREDASKYVEKIKEYVQDGLQFIKEKTGSSKDKLSELAELQKQALKEGRGNLEARLAGAEDRLQGVGERLKVRFDDSRLKATDFLESVLGPDYAKHLPPIWGNNADGIDWRSLATNDFDSTLSDLASGLQNPKEWLKNATSDNSIADLYTNFQTVQKKFCSAPAFTEPAKVPTGCTGASVVLQLVPRSCSLDEIQKQIVCDPAKLVFLYFPPACNLKYTAPADYLGKRCRVTGTIGVSKSVTVGGRIFNVVLSDFSEAGSIVDQFDELVTEGRAAAKNFVGSPAMERAFGGVQGRADDFMSAMQKAGRSMEERLSGQ